MIGDQDVPVTRRLHEQLRWFRHLAGQALEVDMSIDARAKQPARNISPVPHFRPSRTYLRHYLNQQQDCGGYLCYTPRLCANRSNRQEIERQNKWLTVRLNASALEMFPEHQPVEHSVRGFVADLRLYGHTLESHLKVQSRASYEALTCPEKEIRLLKVSPTTKEEDGAERIVCELQAHRLDDAPPFCALSYTWGEPVFDRTIMINGCEHAVTATLLSALTRLRQNGYRTLWIDALCIDQENLAEKSSQVPLMFSIYKRAEMVAIYLGEETGESDEVAQVAPFMVKVATSRELGPMIGALRKRGQRLFSIGDEADVKLEQCGFPPRSDDRWNALYRLLQRPYFRRAWIVQEVAASTAADVIMRGSWIQWEGVHRVYAFLNEEMGTPYRLLIKVSGEVTDNESIEDYQVFMTQEYARRMVGNMENLRSKVQGGGTPLHELLHSCRYNMATDPRDKIYSVLGLSDCATRAPRPDYKLSPQQVYLDYASFLVNEGCGTNVLSSAGTHRHHLPGLGSWTPDWTFITEVTFFNESNKAYWTPEFSASGDSEPCISVVEGETDLLCAEGGVVDRLKAVGPELNIKGWHPWRRDFLKWDMASRKLLEDSVDVHNRTGNELLEVYCRTLVANAFPSWTPFDHVKDYKALIDALAQPLWHFAFSYGEARFSGRCVADITSARAIGVTDKGRIGLVPGIARPGDDLCIVFGARCPFVIRKDGDAHTLIGDAYIDGIMYDGKSMDEEDFVPQEIRLR